MPGAAQEDDGQAPPHDPVSLGVPREGTLATDAPASWPHNGPRPPPEDPAGLGATFWSLQLVDRLDGLNGLTVTKPQAAYLFDEGVVEAACEVRDGDGQRWPVFAFPRNDDEASATYAALRQAFEDAGRHRPVYYAPEPLDLEADPGQLPLTTLAPHHFGPWPEDEEEIAGVYAVWWATDAGQDALTWSGIKTLEQAWAALEGLEGHLAALLLAQAGGTAEGTEEIELPDEPHQRLLVGPDGLPVLLRYGGTPPLLLGLPVDDLSPAKRDLFWAQFGQLCRERREEAEQWGLDPDAGDGSGLETWWQELIDGLYDRPEPAAVLAETIHPG